MRAGEAGTKRFRASCANHQKEAMNPGGQAPRVGLLPERRSESREMPLGIGPEDRGVRVAIGSPETGGER